MKRGVSKQYQGKKGQEWKEKGVRGASRNARLVTGRKRNNDEAWQLCDISALHLKILT
jgi:hypothetical protein